MKRKPENGDGSSSCSTDECVRFTTGPTLPFPFPRWLTWLATNYLHGQWGGMFKLRSEPGMERKDVWIGLEKICRVLPRLRTMHQQREGPSRLACTHVCFVPYRADPRIRRP